MPRRPACSKDLPAKASPPEALRESYHHGKLRAALVEAARGLIDEGGIAALSMRELARRVGVSHSAPYRHFESREAVLAELARDAHRLLSASLVAASHRHRDSTLDTLEALALAYVSFALEHTALFRLMFGDEAGEFSEVEAENSMQHIHSVLTSGQARGEVSSAEPMDLAVAAWSLVHGLATLAIGQRLPSTADPAAIARLASRSMRLLYDGLSATDGDRARLQGFP